MKYVGIKVYWKRKGLPSVAIYYFMFKSLKFQTSFIRFGLKILSHLSNAGRNEIRKICCAFTKAIP